MARKKKTAITVVSPAGKPVWVVKVNFFLFFFPLLFVIGGVGAYFIPSETFLLKAADQNRRRNLSERNFILQGRIQSSQQLLYQIKEQIQLLEVKRAKVAALRGHDENGSRDVVAERNRGQGASMPLESPEAVEEHIRRVDSVFSAFLKVAYKSGNPFIAVPVIKPVTGNYVISQHFGPGKDPFTGGQKWHYGVDFAATPGTPVIATAGGRVSRVENNVVWGRRIVIEHAGGFITLYAHCGTVCVPKGATVRRGDVIGTIGYSGLTTGPHVHYEIWRNGNVVDPETYIFPSAAYPLSR